MARPSATALRARPASRVGDATRAHVGFSLRSQPWHFVNAVLVVWVLVPEIRRLVDWKLGFTPFSPLIAVPLAAALPAMAAFVYTSALPRLQQRLLLPLWAWIGGFGSGLAIGIVSGNPFGALYGFLDFTVNAFFGLWLTTFDVPRKVLYERVAGFLLDLSVPVAIYGFYQFFVLPDWDRTWLLNVKVVAIGEPFPMQFRPFATLNAPATYADFLVGVMLLNLPRLSRARLWRVAQFVLLVAALLVTRVRTAWIGGLCGILVYVALAPQRIRNAAVVGGLALVVVAFAANANAILGPEAGRLLTQRFDTLTDVSQDSSYRERQQYFGDILKSALDQPLGYSLGATGAGARAASADQNAGVFDNGYVARLTEMGFFGFGCYVVALGAALWAAFTRWRQLVREANDLAIVAVAAIALQVSLDVVDLSGDHHNSLGGLFFWLSLGLIFGPRLQRKTS